ncbi:hypothetical protein HDV05_000776 [Chytridiales sp. JEL 0842]|nr:hypothetical protein HDV05_000776 [Chytridiales sp. JEL 0842]
MTTNGGSTGRTAKQLEDDLDLFIGKHSSQLNAMGLPRALWPVLWAKFETERLGSIDFPWSLSVDEETRSPLIVAADNINIQRSLIVYNHDWVFTSRDEAKQHLESSQNLKAAISALIENVAAMHPDESSSAFDEPGKVLETDEILSHLYKIAFQFQIASTPTSPPTTLFTVTTDPLGPAIIPFSPTPLLDSKIFIHSPKDGSPPKAYTLLFPKLSDSDKRREDLLQSFSIEKGTVITRAEMTAMPDYSNPKYWKAHYRTSTVRAYEWFLPWNAISGHLKNIVPAGGSVLNIGCGNSLVGQQMLNDKSASYVLSVDIAESAVQALKSLSKSTENKKQPLEDLLVLDATSLPFRSTSSNPLLFDWAFDKGTLDGLLYTPNPIPLLQKIWAAVSKVSDTFVLVSLGRPETRLPLIEEQIGGWEVSECLEIELKNGGKEGMGGGRIERCWVYVCKHVQ